MMAKAKEEPQLELPVTFGGLSVGDKTCRIGMSVSRANFTVAKADKHLCERRLTVELIARSKGASAGQESLPGCDNDRSVSGVCDVKGFSASGKAISFGATFVLSGVDVEELSHYPKRDGRLVVTGISAIPDGEEDDEEDDEEYDDAE